MIRTISTPRYAPDFDMSMSRAFRYLLFLAVIAVVTMAGSWLVPRPASTQGLEQEETSESPPDGPDDGPTPWLGVQITEDGDAEGPSGEESPSSGARIDGIIENSPAADSSLRVGDLIRKVDDDRIHGLDSLRRALDRRAPGDDLDVEIVRGGAPHTVTVRLKPRPGPESLIRTRFVGEPFPEFEFEPVDAPEESVSTKSFRQRPTIVEFWATWCPPCEKTRTRLTRLHGRWGDRVRIVGISGESRERLGTFTARHSVPYEILRDPDSAAQADLSVASLPTTFVLDEQGEVVELFVGVDELDKLEATVEQLLESDR